VQRPTLQKSIYRERYNISLNLSNQGLHPYNYFEVGIKLVSRYNLVFIHARVKK